MANTIKIKNSGTASNVPSANSLSYGELAINYADGLLFYKNPSNTVISSELITGISGTTNQITATKSSGGYTLSFPSSIVISSDITANGTIISNYSIGDEGGEIRLAKPQTNTSLASNITIDIYQNQLRIFETGGTNRGAYIDFTAASTGVGSNLLSGGGGATNLDSLTDVTVSSPEEFQGLSYNGTAWVNGYIPLVSYVQNAEANTITTGTCVYLYGSTGDHASVKRADNSSDTTSSKTIGVVGANIAASQNGPIVTRGYVDGIDLSTGYTAGDVLWLGTGGNFTKTKPTAPNHLVFIGVVVRATNNGIIYVATQNGYELDELHNVSLPSPQAGEFLKYNGSIWVSDVIDLGTDTTGNYMSDISGTSPVSVSHTPSEGSSATISLASGYGDTQNPFASKNANLFLASPNGSSGVPTFRSIVSADIPTLNQNTTGSAAQWTTARTITLGGDLTGNVSIDGSTDVTLTATVAANSVALGTDTTGNYMANISAGTGISVSHTPGEGSTATVSVNTSYEGFVPTGAVMQYAGSVAPTGWLICDGTAVSRTTYAALWTALGTTSSPWGQGDGSTTFNLPNMVSRFPYGGNAGATAPSISLSANTDHTHTANAGNQSANHAHTITSNSGNQSAAHNHAITSNSGNQSQDHSHNWGNNTGNVSNGHTHNYTDYYGNAAATKTTADINQNHYHYVSGTTSGMSVSHSHAITSNAGNESANHSHAITSNAGNQSADHNHAITVSSTVSMTHSHSVTATQFIYIIKV